MAEKKTIVTLNLGSQRVGMARFSCASDGSLTLKAYHLAEIGGDPTSEASRVPQMAVAVNDLVDSVKVAGQRVNFAISGQSVFTRFVKLPPLGSEKVHDIVQFEAQQNVPFPLNEVIWDYQVVNDEGEVEVAIVAIKSDSLNEINDAVAESSLKTNLVDVAHAALINAFRYNYSDVEGCALLVDMGARSTNLIYVEGDKVFSRNIPVGGSNISTNIAREFGIPFARAEERKVKEGFVALGGNYADHPDPEVDAISKISRNTLTRLHSEIVRTTKNMWQRQQAGSEPQMVFLAGGVASMPYIKEFFEEKLGVSVDFFNPLRAVAVDPGVNVDQLSTEAHCVGELIGLGLRGAGKCPMEIDLVPDAVARARDVAKRKPFLIGAIACLVGALGLGIWNFQNKKSLAEKETASLKSELNSLESVNEKIEAANKDLKEAQSVAQPMVDAAEMRSFWLRLMNDLNGRLENDLLWFTVVEPLADKEQVTPQLWQGGDSREPITSNIVAEKTSSAAARNDEKVPKVTHVRVLGLYRDAGNQAGNQVVYDFVTNEIMKSPFFDIEEEYKKDPNNIVTYAEAGVSGYYAYPFELYLKLAEPVNFYQKIK